MVKIPQETLRNTTHFILWTHKESKYTMVVEEYVVHPEYYSSTVATIALLRLSTIGPTGTEPVLPVCMPWTGATGVYNDLYVIKTSDEHAEVEKEVRKMIFLENPVCEEFYQRAKLNYTKMIPVHPLCVFCQEMNATCVWEGGAALVARHSWAHWKLLGVGVRGPGCKAPSQFVNILNYIEWITQIINAPSIQETPYGSQGLLIRRMSPGEIHIERSNSREEYGLCKQHARGHVVYKDKVDLVVNRDFGQGFYFVAVSQLAQFTCVIIRLDCNSRSNLRLWVEHNCHRDLSGNIPLADERKQECFVYFKSVAYVEFRFVFSYTAVLEVTMFADEEVVEQVPSPWATEDTTEAWWPTSDKLRWGWFIPTHLWWYHV